ncbi:MAG: hypothetical protein ACK4N6_07695, partial [Rhodocyclaceae bacterium]
HTYHEKHPRRPAIAVSAAAIELEGVAATIAKPIKIEQLIETIRQVAERLEPETSSIPVQTRPSAQAASPAQVNPPASVSTSAAAAVVDAVVSTKEEEEEEEEKTLRILPLRSERKPAAEHAPPAESPATDVSAVCGNTEDIDCNDETQVSRLFLPVDGRLLATLQAALTQAKTGERTIAVRYKESSLAVFQPRGRAVIVPVSDNVLQRSSQVVFSGNALILDKLHAHEVPRPGPVAVHPDVLIWKVAAWTYRGRLPVGLHPNQRVYLRHWPNLTRLLALPDAMRIAALLNEQPMSMSRLAEALKIPQRHVFAFCACAHAIDLLGVAKRAADHLIEPPPAPPAHGERLFLGRLMHYLKGLVGR